MDARPAADSHATLAHWMGPLDANGAGFVGVRVDTENPRTGKRRHSNSAYLTMVAVDEHGNPMPVPPLLASTDEEHRRESEAQLRRRNRLAEREQIKAGR